MSVFQAAYRKLSYMLSLPERSLRALAALASGTTTLLTETLLPESLRGTRIYGVTFGLMQAYIIEKVAQIEQSREAPLDALTDDFVQRKMVGTVLETAGLFMVGASPLWIFAILADVSGGGKVFLDRLAAQLRAQGVIDSQRDFARIEDVLDAVQHASTRTATLIDTPPVSRAELRRMVAEMRAHYSDTFRTTVDLVPTLESLWQSMESLAGKDESLFARLAGMMTVDALELGRRGGRTVASVGAAGLQLFDEGILASYRRTLAHVSSEGVRGYLRSHYAPFLDAAIRHFDSNRSTWTERSLGARDGEESDPL